MDGQERETQLFKKFAEAHGGSTPSQYGLPEGAIELQDLIEHREMNFALGNIFKACYRIGTKNDNLYEINKIIWFAERLKKQAESKWIAMD
jgi:hypothetical protein